MSDQASSGSETLTVGWSLGLGWVSANAAGCFVGARIGGFIDSMFWLFGPTGRPSISFATETILSLSVNLFMVGLSVGIAQWIVLRRHVERSGLWVLATILGTSISIVVASAMLHSIGGETISSILANSVPKILANVSMMAAFGAFIGLAQWLVLRQRTSQAGWWVLANSLGWAAGGATGLMLAIGIVVGAITGFVLVRLMRSAVLEVSSS